MKLVPKDKKVARISEEGQAIREEECQVLYFLSGTNPAFFDDLNEACKAAMDIAQKIETEQGQEEEQAEKEEQIEPKVQILFLSNSGTWHSRLVSQMEMLRAAQF